MTHNNSYIRCVESDVSGESFVLRHMQVIKDIISFMNERRTIAKTMDREYFIIVRLINSSYSFFSSERYFF